MADQTAQSDEVVMQGDYGAAAEFFRDQRIGLAVKFRLGQNPEPLLEAFARHRIASTATLQASLDEARAEIARLWEALTPSGDTKAAYIGEFSWYRTDWDEFGDEHQVQTYVPWDTIKEIMAAIRARAALKETAS